MLRALTLVLAVQLAAAATSPCTTITPPATTTTPCTTITKCTTTTPCTTTTKCTTTTPCTTTTRGTTTTPGSPCTTNAIRLYSAKEQGLTQKTATSNAASGSIMLGLIAALSIGGLAVVAVRKMRSRSTRRVDAVMVP